MPCTLIITRYSYCSVPAKAAGHAVTQLGCLAPSTSILTNVEQKKTCIVLWWGDGFIMTGPPPVMKCLESLGKFEKHLVTRTGKNDVAITPTHTRTKEKYLNGNCTENNQTCSKTNKTTH